MERELMLPKTITAMGEALRDGAEVIPIMKNIKVC
jgi:hypothetical protein